MKLGIQTKILQGNRCFSENQRRAVYDFGAIREGKRTAQSKSITDVGVGEPINEGGEDVIISLKRGHNEECCRSFKQRRVYRDVIKQY